MPRNCESSGGFLIIPKLMGKISGLAAGVHSKDTKKCWKVAKGLEAGSIYMNFYNRVHHQVPFGGYKLRGIGRELVRLISLWWIFF